MSVLITGATGFVGSALVSRLHQNNIEIARALRSPIPECLANCSDYVVGSIGSSTDWGDVLEGVSCVVHLAARVHVMNDNAVGLAYVYKEANTSATLHLARKAAAAGVKRFVFVSSVKANGEYTSSGEKFTSFIQTPPTDPYGLSKYEAELGLKRIAAETGLEVTIIRPPLVYGPGVKANFRRMMALVHKGTPLPFGALSNKRSLVALGNLVDLLVCCIEHKQAANKTFMVSDGDDLSTTDMLTLIATSFDRSARLIAVPESIMRLSLRMLGKGDLAMRLFGSLQVDISDTCKILNWQPPVSVELGFQQAVDAYKNEKTL